MKPELIINAVCEFYKIPVELIKSVSRKKEIVKARFVVMFFMKEHTDSSLSRIGSYFGKDHATVIYGVRKVNKRLFTEPIFKNELRIINVKLDQIINEGFNKYKNYETDRC